MNKELFKNQLKQRLEEITECQVKIQTNHKNNGVILESLIIMRKGRNVYPTIYIDIWWDAYKAGESFESIITRVLEWEKKTAIDNIMDFDFFLNFDKVKENLRYKIINTEKNIEILNSIPHKDFLDLSKVYMVEVSTPGIGKGTVLIFNVHIEMWGIRWEELDRYATEQTEENNILCISDRKYIIKELMGEIVEEEETDITDLAIPQSEMYVFTNEERCYGASVLLYQDVIKNFALDIGDDLYILPSSTHELIVIPARIAWYIGEKHLKAMVQEVNATQVQPEEFLSDNVYHYNRDTDKIEIV